MKFNSILVTILFLFVCSQSDAQMIERTDAMWARTVTEGTITMDGVLDEPAWENAESWIMIYGQDAGIPNSGWGVEGGVETSDSTYAILRFLVEGKYLYMGATIYDQSIGGSSDWARWDGLLMNIPDRTVPGRPTPPGEYFYAWWYPQAATALPAGLGPRFIGRWAQWEYDEPRTEEQIEAWDAVTTVQGLSNDDSVPDTSWTVEMRFNLEMMGYDLQNPDGEIVEFNISIWDADWLWPFDDEKFSSNRVWWQNPWGNNNGHNKARIYAHPDITAETQVLPELEPEAFIPNAANHTPPVINGALTDMVWEYAPGFDIRFGDDELRDSYPGIGPYRSGQWQPEINEVLAEILDPADATVKWFFIEDTLYLGFDIRDQVVTGTDEFDLRDGVRVTLNHRELRDGANMLAPRELFVWVGEDGQPRHDGDLAVLVDSLNAARVGIALNENTIVNDPTNVDEGYSIEMAIDLTALGYPSGRGDGVVFMGFTIFDGDIMENPADTYGNRAWWFRENGGNAAAAWVYMDPDMYLEHPGVELPESSWNFAGIFPDEESANHSAHGLAVDNEGKVWIGPYYSRLFVPTEGDTIRRNPLYVFNADGTPADFSPIYEFDVDGEAVRFGPITGLNRDHEGNILVAIHGLRPLADGSTWDQGTAHILRIDPMTGELIGLVDVTSMRTETASQAPNRPSVTEDGYIFVSYVFPGSPIIILDPDFELVQAVTEDGKTGFSRTLEVSADGTYLFQPGFTQNFITVYRSEFGVLGEYEIYDTTLAADMWPGAVNRDPLDDNVLWVTATGGGNDPLPETSRYYGHDNKVFAIDLTTREIVDYAEWPATPFRIPRALAFSPDGEILYVGTFTTGVPTVHKFTKGPVSVRPSDRTIAENFSLTQNYPNPFNPTTTIQFSLPTQTSVRLDIYNMLGQRVKTLVADEMLQAGNYDVVWNGTNDQNITVPSGMYIYRITAGNFVASKRMMFLK